VDSLCINQRTEKMFRNGFNTPFNGPCRWNLVENSQHGGAAPSLPQTCFFKINHLDHRVFGTANAMVGLVCYEPTLSDL